jgi:hypothetical protein
MDVQIHIYLTSAVVGGEWSAPATLLPGERDPGISWIGTWVDPRTSVENLEKRIFLDLLGLKLQCRSHSACNKLLYQLHNPGTILQRISNCTIQAPFYKEYLTKSLSIYLEYLTVLMTEFAIEPNPGAVWCG